MKKNLLFVLFFLCVGLSAQNLSLNELIALRKMDLDDAESYLVNKGWTFIKGSEPTDETLGKAIFAYGASSTYDYAESFVSIYYRTFGENRINIQFTEQNKYNEFLAGVRKFAPTPINTKVEDNKLVKVYSGATTTFESSSGVGSNRYGDQMPRWHLFIVENQDYETEFGYY